MKIAHTLILSMSAAVAGLLVMQSCTSDPSGPGLEYMPDMYRSQAYETYDTSRIGKGSSSLLPVAGTIPRYDEETLPYYAPYAYPNTNEGYEVAGLQLSNPYTASETILKKGEYIFTNFCIHCHGEKGDGNGILVEREKIAGVPSYYGPTIKDLPVGKMYHTLYYGKNNMGSHASQINFEERWAVIRWVEKLRAAGLGVGTATDSTGAQTVKDTTSATSTAATASTK